MSTHNMFLWRTKKNIHLVPSLIWRYGSDFRVYHINPKYTDTLTPYHTYPKFKEIPLPFDNSRN